jgi:hypothetical protein
LAAEYGEGSALGVVVTTSSLVLDSALLLFISDIVSLNQSDNAWQRGWCVDSVDVMMKEIILMP